MKKIECVLFLDFDGVFHFFCPQPDASDVENSFFYFVPEFSKVITEFMDRIDFKLVISSSWRENKTFDQLKSPFPDGIRNMIIGITPIHYENSDGSRLREAEEWIDSKKYSGKWLAIDDNPDIWYNHQNLILCDDGFTQQISDELVLRLNSIIGETYEN